MKEDLFGDVVGVVFQQEVRIQNYTLVVEVCSRGEGGVVKRGCGGWFF